MNFIKNKVGSALITVLCFTGILFLTAFTMLTLSQHALSISVRLREDAATLALAEAGVGDMLDKMGAGVTNYYYWLGRTNIQEFGEGKFTVIVRQNPNTHRVLIKSTGKINNNQRTTVLEILGNMIERYDNALGVDGVILVDGNLYVRDGAGQIDGNVHANQNIIALTGASKPVNGIVTVSGNTIEGVDASGGWETGAKKRDVPDFLPFTEWKQLAKDDGIYIDDDITWSQNTTIQPNNGIVYVAGDANFRNRSILKGHLIAAGDVSHGQNFTHIPVNTNYPAILAGGNIDLRQRGEGYHGIIWAAGDIHVGQNKSITGALIARGNMHMQNSVTLGPLGEMPDWMPETVITQDVEIIIGGWIQ